LSDKRDRAMKRGITHLCAAALAMFQPALLAQSAQVPPSEAPQTFKSSVDVVTIQASVRDGRGRVVSGLRPTDFEVLDSCPLRQILSLRSDRQSRLSLAVLVDMSGSMRIGPKVEMAPQSYVSVLADVGSGPDEVALFTFDAELRERREFKPEL